jgi:hypothetical protein
MPRAPDTPPHGVSARDGAADALVCCALPMRRWPRRRASPDLMRARHVTRHFAAPFGDAQQERAIFSSVFASAF